MSDRNKISNKHPDNFDLAMEYLERAETAESELATLKEQTRWRLIAEETPPTDILVDVMNKKYLLFGVATYSFDTKEWRFITFVPTHWRPLPSLPEDV